MLLGLPAPARKKLQRKRRQLKRDLYQPLEDARGLSAVALKLCECWMVIGRGRAV